MFTARRYDQKVDNDRHAYACEEMLGKKLICMKSSQFVPHTMICTDKTLITINILNSNEHAYAAQPTREKGVQ